MKQETKQAIDNYVSKGIPVGSFVRAVICNNLFGAVGRADLDNKKDLFEICSYIYNEIPSDCWGSSKTYDTWIEKHREIRERKELTS